MKDYCTEYKAELIITQFAGNSTLVSKGKQPRRIPEVECSMIGIVSKHHTNRHILDGLNVNKVSVLVFKKFALEPTPVQWKPNPEKENKTLPSNYRPIALMSIITNFMENAIYYQETWKF